MTKPFLTLGMAAYADFNGVYFTVQALRMYHDLTDCEIIVVDNKPDSEDSKLLGSLRTMPNVRLIEMPEQTGTTQPRNRVFAEAQGDFAVCMDSHVLLIPNAVQRLKEYWSNPEHTKHFVSGPILWDTLTAGATHFDDYWRGEMWGIWGQAWVCPCRGESFLRPHFHFSVLPTQQAFCSYRGLVSQQPVDNCSRCGRKLPAMLPFNAHEQALQAQGYVRLGFDPAEPPFEVPAQGLGLFGCNKVFWDELGGFNKDFRGFGGEEMYVHEKVRRHGGKVMCLPFLAWGHRFGRPGGVKFPLTRYQKVRNYVLGAIELATDSQNEKERLAPIEEHFVTSGLMPREQWNKLLSDPKSETIPPEHSRIDASGRPLPPLEAVSLEDKLEWCKGVPRDLNEHVVKLAELAGQCTHVVEFTGRRESTVGLFVGVMRNQGYLLSYNTEEDGLLKQFAAEHPDNILIHALDSDHVPTIPETDLLFLDSSPHTYQKVWAEFEKYAGNVKRYMVLHDTAAYGPQGSEPGTQGLWDAMRTWMEQHPEWFIVFHTNQQYGLTVLSRQPQDKPAQEIRPWPKGTGPGTELKELLGSLGIHANANCSCNAKAREMDELGVEGCRREFERLVNEIKAGMHHWGWADKFKNFAKGGFTALFRGLVLKVSWLDPIPDLVKMAIDEAEKKESK